MCSVVCLVPCAYAQDSGIWAELTHSCKTTLSNARLILMPFAFDMQLELACVKKLHVYKK
jgi:hypothetical protein